MSMICNVRRVLPDELERLLETPAYITTFLYGESAAAAMPRGLLARLFSSAPPPPVTWAPRVDGDEIDIEKAWHGLHFMFTGTAWEGSLPAAFLLAGGREIGKVDVGYGPARAFRPDDVRQVAAYLSGRSEQELQQRYDPPRMTALKIYPEIWDPGDDDEQVEYLVDAFGRLREFVVATRDAGAGLIIYLN
jgi:hypothetical protein